MGTPIRLECVARESDGHLVKDLHGVTLAAIVEFLVEKLGYEKLAQ